jgi:hypothetical protein
MAVGSVGSSPAVPATQLDSPSQPGRSNAQSDAFVNNVTQHLAQSALQAAAHPDAFKALTADAPKLLLGLIPVVGPFILLADVFGKVAQYSGTAQASATPAPGTGSVIPNKALAVGPRLSRNGELEARAQAQESIGVEKEVSGSFGDERTGSSGRARASAQAGARADAVASVGPDGVRAAAGARAEARADASVEGELHGELGRVRGEANAHASAYAEATGEARATTSGVSATATASTGVEAGADARVSAQTAPLVKLGGYECTAGAIAEGYAVSGAGASCSAEATASFNPPEVVGQVGARAFAGARAGTSASVGIGPFNVDVGIDARAGAGVEYGLDFGLKDGKLNIKGFAGIAAAIGLGTNFNLSIDFNQIGAAVAGIFGQVAMDAPKGSLGQTAAAGISEFVKFATPFAAQAAQKYAHRDLLDGKGTYQEEASATVKRTDPQLEKLDSSERDALQEADMRQQREKLERDTKRFGTGARSKLDSTLV